MYMYSRYMKWRIRKCIIASRIWLLTYKRDIYACELCPDNNIQDTKTNLSCTQMPLGRNMPDEIYICSRCLNLLHKKQLTEQWYTERRLYGLRRDANQTEPT